MLARCVAALAVAVLVGDAAQAQELKTVKIGVVNLSTDARSTLRRSAATSKRKASRPISTISIPAPR